MTPRWHPVADAGELAARASHWVLAAAQTAIAARGVFSIVLAGGETPRATYQRLRRASADWSRWQIWFGDERCLPPADSRRNSRMAGAAWLDHVALDAGQIHGIAAEHGAVPAAAAYTRALCGAGIFDLVLLGLGDDGHTASLFPGHDLGIGAGAPPVLAVMAAPKPPAERVTLGAARLADACQVLFLVAGESKRDAVAAWRAGAPIPASAIRPAGGVDVLVEASLLA